MTTPNPTPTTHHIDGLVEKSFVGLGPDQFRARLITGQTDMEKEVTRPAGATPNRGTIPLCWNHDPDQVIGKAAFQLVGDYIEIIGTFLPEGVFDRADYARALVRGDFVTGVSAGFLPIKKSRDKKTGGLIYETYTILEASVVPIPADTAARVTQRSLDARRTDRMARVAEVAKRGRQLLALELTRVGREQDARHQAAAQIPYTRDQRIAKSRTAARGSLSDQEKRIADLPPGSLERYEAERALHATKALAAVEEADRSSNSRAARKAKVAEMARRDRQF